MAWSGSHITGLLSARISTGMAEITFTYGVKSMKKRIPGNVRLHFCSPFGYTQPSFINSMLMVLYLQYR